MCTGWHPPERILLLERGGYLPREADNWNSKKVFLDAKYKATEEWYDKDGQPFHPGAHYWAGDTRVTPGRRRSL